MSLSYCGCISWRKWKKFTETCHHIQQSIRWAEIKKSWLAWAHCVQGGDDCEPHKFHHIRYRKSYMFDESMFNMCVALQSNLRNRYGMWLVSCEFFFLTRPKWEWVWGFWFRMKGRLGRPHSHYESAATAIWSTLHHNKRRYCSDLWGLTFHTFFL